MQRFEKLVLYLCERVGEDGIHARDSAGKTPLFYALSTTADQTIEGRRCLEVLLEFGVDPNDRIMSSALNETLRGTRITLRGKSISRQTMVASSKSNMSSVHRRVRPKIVFEPGSGALHICARYNLKNLAKLLLLSDANASLPSIPTGIVPLAIALESDFHDMARILLDLGAHPNIRDRIGRTPLHFAKSVESAKLLVAFGARPEIVPDSFNNNSDARALKFVRKRYLEKTTGISVVGDKMALESEWVDDVSSDSCLTCGSKFSFIKRKHHCRRCGVLTCQDCSYHQFISYDAQSIISLGKSKSLNQHSTSSASVDVRERSPDMSLNEENRPKQLISRDTSRSVTDLESGKVAQRCCDACYNFLTYSKLYDFEDIVEGNSKSVHLEKEKAKDDDESDLFEQKKDSTLLQLEEEVKVLKGALDAERKSNRELAIFVEQLTSSKKDFENEVENLQSQLKTLHLESTSTKRVQELEQKMKESEDMKVTVINALIEELASMESQVSQFKRLSSFGSTMNNKIPSADQNTIAELEAQILELKKVISNTQKEHEDLLKVVEGADRGSKRGAPSGKNSSNFGSLKRKNIAELESRIANLEFQLVYGQTKKDQTISKLEEKNKQLEQDLKDALHRSVESWIFDSEDLAIL
jgi:ankyrin repeat protein